MTHITTLVQNIAAISIPGVSVRDLAHIPEAVSPTMCPILYPEPRNRIQNLAITRDTTGAAAIALKTLTYTLNYTFLYMPVGAARGLEKEEDMVNKLVAIIEAIELNDGIAGAININVQGVELTEPFPDAAGSAFIGCSILVDVTEFMEM